MYYFNTYCESLDCNYVCSCEQKLKKQDVVVIEACSSFVTAVVEEMLEELDVLLGDYCPKEIIQFIDVTDYKKRKEALTKKALLRKQMNDRTKVVKELECFRKLSGSDEIMKELLHQFNMLEGIEKEQETEHEEKVSD